MNYIKEYTEQIKNKKIIVNEYIKKVYFKLADEIDNPADPYIFNEAKAERPIKFIEKFCKHSKGEFLGREFKLMLWQKAFISALFGFVNKDTGLRRFKETFLYCARKNGKTSLLSAIALYCLIVDEKGASVVCAATKRDQARLIFDEALNMVRQSPELNKFCKKRKTDLYIPLTFSSFTPLSSEAQTLDGLNISCAIIDELHAIKDRGLYDIIRTATSARTQPLIISITTAGAVRESVFDDLYKYAKSCANGDIIDNAFLPILYEMDNREEIADPNTWIKANPSLYEVKKIDDLVNKIERAKNNPADLSAVLCKDFNIISTNIKSFLSWNEINNEAKFNIADLRNKFFIGGCDLSSCNDLTACTALIMNSQEEIFIYQMYFLPEATFNERLQSEKIPYDKWLNQGLLRLCKGEIINYDDCINWFMELVEKYGLNPAYIYYDPWCSQYFTRAMEQKGFRMIKLYQDAKRLSNPLKELAGKLKEHKINYNDNPLLKWCLSNLGVKTDINNNILPIKTNSKKYKIDGAASLLDAYAGLIEHYEEIKNLN